MSWAQYIAMQILIFACLYAWKIDGVEGAGNLLQVVLWTLAAAGIAGIFMPTGPSVQPRNELRKAVGTCNALILLAALIWFGHIVLAAAYLLGLFGAAVYRDRFDAEGNPIPPKSSTQPPAEPSPPGCKP
eukprot:gene37885-46751_t